MKFITKITFLIIFFAGIYSCSEDTVYNAKPLTLEELKSLPGFLWFSPEYDAYKPDSARLIQIKNAFVPDEHRFIFYASLTCSCTLPQEKFPRAVKTLDSAGIDKSYYEIYSMTSTIYRQPYDTIFKVNKLPALMIMKKGKPVFSVIDSMNAAKGADTLKKIEDYVLEGLLK